MVETSGLTFVLGGARSGKSDFAERMASEYGVVDYIATAELIDEEMVRRVTDHRNRRPDAWKTVEPADLTLPDAIRASRAEVVLIDSMTLYVARVMERESDPANHMLRVIKEVTQAKPDVIVVSDEVGFGVVPASPEGRHFRDLLGWVNQLLAAASARAYLVVAGIPVAIKEGETS